MEPSAAAVAALRALADPARLAAARLLVEGAFNVGEIQQVLQLGQSTASRNLKILVDAGLAGCRREGREVFYHWLEPLAPAREALREFVRAHAADALDAEARRRLHAVFEGRTERSRRFFDAAKVAPGAAPALASEKARFAAGDAGEAMLAWVPPSRVLADLGTGAGRQLSRLRGRARRVIGVDASPRMLEAAGALARREGWDDVELRLGTLEHLPLRDGEADVAFAHLVLHHAARPEIALAEAWRVLAPGGVLVVGDYLPHHEEWMRQELADQWLGFEPAAVARLMAECRFSLSRWERVPASPGAPALFVAAALKNGDPRRRAWFEAGPEGRRGTRAAGSEISSNSGKFTSRPARARKAAPAPTRRPKAAARGDRRP